MTRGMNTMPTMRRGRTHFHPGSNEKRGLSGICSVIFIILFLAIPPIIFYGSESTRHVRFLTLREALHSDIVELNHLSHELDEDALRALERNAANAESILSGRGGLVHGTSGEIDAVSSDGSMGVSIPGALTLRRNTEYCQWQEIQSQNCQTCTRTVSAKDGSTKEESYSCNCVTHYDYVKAWRNFRINSLSFDQPGAHHNPQRDPMPSRMFTAEDATLTFHQGHERFHEHDREANSNQQQQRNHNARNANNNSLQTYLNPSMLTSGIRSQPFRRVDFVPNGMAPSPSFFSRLLSSILPTSWTIAMTRNTRYEPLQLLRDTPTSLAATRDNFVYVGQGGYFFSPYESSMTSQLFNYFVQYMEGSLFDWQLGDLMPSCTAGDVRFYYEVQDPSVVSVLGHLGSSVRNDLEIRPRVMDGSTTASSSAGLPASSIGLVHSGSHSAEHMLVAEDNDSRNAALLIRGLLLLWSIPASRLIGVAFGRELSDSSFAVQTMAVIGTSATLLGGSWMAIWGIGISSFSSTGVGGGRDTVLLLFMGGYFLYLAYRSAVPRGIGRRWHAVWCRIGEWAQVPPEWRVEDTYVVQPSRGDSRHAHGKNLSKEEITPLKDV